MTKAAADKQPWLLKSLGTRSKHCNGSFIRFSMCICYATEAPAMAPAEDEKVRAVQNCIMAEDIDQYAINSTTYHSDYVNFCRKMATKTMKITKPALFDALTA